MRKMKNMLRITAIAFAMLLAGVFGAAGTAGAPAAGSVLADQAYAADDAYTYTLTVYSGKEGYFDGDKDKHSKILTKNAKYGQSYTIDMEELDLTVADPGKYYARGIKAAGHDNDEVSHMTYQSYTFNVTKDEAFTVAYGMKGGMVKYTVNYEDESGDELLSPQEYYGMAGDKPVVSCKYVEGYIPESTNIAKTLVADESQNVFTFTYLKNGSEGSEAEEEGDEDADEDNGGNDNGANAGNNGNANAGGNANANGAGAAGDGAATANIGDNGTPLANVTDLDDNDTPMAPGSDEKSEGLLSGMTGLMGGIVGAGILIALLLLYLVLRKKKGEEE